jgi:diphthamide biosynthesis enzyme Dph1/Dph2-like protein
MYVGFNVDTLCFMLIYFSQAWVQVACPRLSIDWGAGFNKVSLYPAFMLHLKQVF